MTEEEVHKLKSGDKIMTPEGLVVIDEIMATDDRRAAAMIATYVAPKDPGRPVLGMMLWDVLEDGEAFINTEALALEFLH